MPRPLQPCGTPAAYRRHKRRGEPVDEACAAAGREQKSVRVVSAAAASTAKVSVAVQAAAVEPEVPEVLDEVKELRKNLRMVNRVMETATHSTIVNLSKRQQEIIAEIKRLERLNAPTRSRLDELAARRTSRISEATA